MPDHRNDAASDDGTSRLSLPPLALEAYLAFRSWEALWQRQPAEYLASEVPPDVQTTIRVYLQGLEEILPSDAPITLLMTTATTGDPSREVRMTRLAALDVILPVAAYLAESLRLGGTQPPAVPGSRSPASSQKRASGVVVAQLPNPR